MSGLQSPVVSIPGSSAVLEVAALPSILHVSSALVGIVVPSQLSDKMLFRDHRTFHAHR